MEYAMNARQWVMLDHTDQAPPDAWYCATDSTWRGRFEKFAPYVRAEGVHDPNLPLMTSVIGEIGDNCFAHNLGTWRDVPGCWFAWSHDAMAGVLRVEIADRGQGFLASLQRVRRELTTHRAALLVALTEWVSGRAPEDRGRGLKLL